MVQVGIRKKEVYLVTFENTGRTQGSANQSSDRFIILAEALEFLVGSLTVEDDEDAF